MYNKSMHQFRQVRSGQTVLIIVLVMTIALTVGLSLINRTTTDIRVTSQFEDSARAFSAAEAGIEQSLATFQNAQGQYDNGLTYVSTVSDLGTDITPYQLPLTTTRVGQAGTVFLTGHTSTGAIDWNTRFSGSLYFCWKQATDSDSMPAIELTVFRKTPTGTYSTVRYVYDPLSRNNGFTRTFDTNDCGTGLSGMAAAEIWIPNSPAAGFFHVRPYYSNALVYVKGVNSTLPPQGNTITSTGSIPGGATRKITVVRLFKTPPSLFDYVLYSEGDIVH